jgi:uncharacterized protein with PIN domain
LGWWLFSLHAKSGSALQESIVLSHLKNFTLSRILKGYKDRFRELLLRANARRADQGTQWLLTKAKQLSEQQGISLNDSLERLYQTVSSRGYFRRRQTARPPTGFFCDAGLGGLARWLRAAGYEALWQPKIQDGDLLRQVKQNGTILLTTDSMLMERRVVRERAVRAFWLPPTLKLEKQVEVVFREFHLKIREPRCMTCGGELVICAKEKLRERIPPKTYRWLDQYFVCRRCDKLFWRGTHWDRIRRQLERIQGVCRGVS